MRNAASAVADIEDELQGGAPLGRAARRSAEPLAPELKSVNENVAPLSDKMAAVRANVDPLSDALERRLGSLEERMQDMSSSITELHGDLKKIPGI